jgi:hypothetical protein
MSVRFPRRLAVALSRPREASMFRTRPSSRTVARGSVAVVGAVAALALTGCSLIGGDGDGGGGGTALKPEDSPLSQWFEANVESSDFDEGEFDEQQKKLQELVATCMADQGFDYTPQDTSGMVVMGGEEGEEFDEKKFAAEQGYGMFNYQTSTDEDSGDAEEWTDPNEDYLATMSDTERAAYETALYGDMAAMEPDENGEMPEIDPSQQGCYGIAQDEVWGGEQELWENEEMTAFQDEMTRLYESVNDDPKVAELNTKWADCMADAGITDFANPQEPQEWFMEKQNGFYEEMDPESTEDLESTPEWKALADQEIETAVADYDCREKLDYADAQLEAQFALEKAWIAEHADQLERVKKLYQDAGL